MKLKPFTCFLCALALMLIALSPWLIQSYYSEPSETETYKGILTLWNITGWRTGGSSYLSFLKKRVQEYESRNAHIFIDVVELTGDEAAAAVQNGETPDMVSYPIGFDPGFSLALLPSMDTLFPRITGRAYPYLCGGYCMMINTDMLDSEGMLAPAEWGVRPDELIGLAELGVCFDSESGYLSLPSITAHEYPEPQGPGSLMPDDADMPEAALRLSVVSFSDGLRLFGTEQAGILVASQRQLFELGNLLEDSSAPSFRPYALSGYTDMAQLISVAACEDDIKLAACEEFAKSLLGESVQKKAEALGVFPVLPGLDIYDDNECMFMMYQLLSKDALLVSPENRQTLADLSINALGGNKKALEDIRDIIGSD